MQQHFKRKERLIHSHERAFKPIKGLRLAIKITDVVKRHDKTSSIEFLAVIDGSYKSTPPALLVASTQKLDQPTPPRPVSEEIGRGYACIVDD